MGKCLSGMWRIKRPLKMKFAAGTIGQYLDNSGILSNFDDNNLLKCFARCCVQRQYYCQPLSLVRMESRQIFYRPRHKGKQHLALRGVGVTLRLPARRASLQLGEAGGQTRSFLNPLLMFFRSMVCLSHEPYYFSTRWNTNSPNILSEA